MIRHLSGVVLCSLVVVGCHGRPAGQQEAEPAAAPAETPASAETAAPVQPAMFADDLEFLRAYTQVVVLTSTDGRAQVAIAPGYQGRVMTSTADGPTGASFGFLDRAVIQQGIRQPHMTVLGGEDRFWLGPEGGQFGLYFPAGSTFDTDHWQVPESIDWGPWPVVDQDAQQVTFERDITVTNYSGTTFSLTVRRNVQLLDDDAIARAIGRVPGDSLRVVGFESDNRVTNTGLDAWRKDTGAVSIWILGQFRPGPKTTVVLPFVAGPAAERGPIVNDAYFGPIGPGRLRTGHDAVFLRADGAKRGKIGLPPRRARDVAGSYDPDMRVLTLIEFTHPAGATDYVNSMWEHQKQPFAGDVVNAYNDGPLGPGQPPLGPFYEVESSSPAALLGPGDSITHVHRTVHIQGPEAELDAIAREKLGVSLAEMTRW